MIEAVKFLVTGVTNTAVDFAVLNLLILMFGISTGDPKFILFKGISYVVASVNSFMLNKLWVFNNRKAADSKQIGSFALVNGMGLLVNTVVSLLVFHAATVAFTGNSPHVWANVGALCGTAVVMVFNFIMYKYVVFNKKSANIPVK